jgi:class 3 adenylate cyclase
MFYVVFARVNGLADIASDRIAGAIECLARVAEDVGQERPEVLTYSSVYGRFWVVPRSVREVLRCAEAVLEAAAAGGVRLGVGITVGRIEVTQDLLEENLAGMAINHAARLAFLDGNEGCIAVDEEVVGDATDAGPFTAASFSSPQAGKVKRTELRYRWLERPSPSIAEVPSSQVSDTLAQVVVYDIVRFSEMPQRDLVRAVEDLRHAVRRSLESAGLVRWTDGDDLWYAPAGDGGVVVFGPERGRAVWSFVQALLAHTADRVPVRVGIASGIVVVVGENLPVGKGVLRADRLSGLAEVGQPCVSQRFWKLLDDHEKENWLSEPMSEDTEALKVRKRPYTNVAARTSPGEQDGDLAGEILDLTKDHPKLS